jgi:serine/threonine protein phosphatase 1
MLVSKVKPTQEDKMVFLGDYVDRGNRVVQTVEYMMELKEKFPNTVFLKGNHEDMFLKYLTGDNWLDAQSFLHNGGRSTVEDYAAMLNMEPDVDGKFELDFTDLPEEHQKFYDELEVMHVDGDYVFVHAGLRHNIDLDKQDSHDVMWLRETFMYNPINTWGGKTIIHGHTPMEIPDAIRYHEKYPDRYNLDTGCIFGYNLSCIIDQRIS